MGSAWNGVCLRGKISINMTFPPQETEKRQEEERIRMENILSGNPLLNYTSQVQKGDLKVSHWDIAAFTISTWNPLLYNMFCAQVKRRWDDDVVFKNCARSEPDKKKDQQFINDSLRSEFHRKFMEKYVKWTHVLQIIQADPQFKLFWRNNWNSAENTMCGMLNEHLTGMYNCVSYFMIHTNLDTEAAFSCIQINYNKVLYFIEM